VTEPITDARVLELARKFEQYPGAKVVTLAGPGILEFARALLAEQAGAAIAKSVDMRLETGADA
jgi:hypothetical protein